MEEADRKRPCFLQGCLLWLVSLWVPYGRCSWRSPFLSRSLLQIRFQSVPAERSSSRFLTFLFPEVTHELISQRTIIKRPYGVGALGQLLQGIREDWPLHFIALLIHSIVLLVEKEAARVQYRVPNRTRPDTEAKRSLLFHGRLIQDLILLLLQRVA